MPWRAGLGAGAGGTGPTRSKVMVPDEPLLLPAREVVAERRGRTALEGHRAASHLHRCSGQEASLCRTSRRWFRRSAPESSANPGVKAPCAVYHRCPAAPALAPFGMYVNHDKKNAPEFGATSAVNPCPDVAAPRVPTPGKREVRIGGIRSRDRASHVRQQARQRYRAGAAGTVGEAVRQLPAGARVKAQRRRPDRLRIGGRRSIEVAAGVLIDRQRRVGLSGYHRPLERVPALALRSTDHGVEGEPAHEGLTVSRRLIGNHLQPRTPARWSPARTTTRSGRADLDSLTTDAAVFTVMVYGPVPRAFLDRSLPRRNTCRLSANQPEFAGIRALISAAAIIIVRDRRKSLAS